MAKIDASVDNERYTWSDDGTCTLTGWRGSEKEGTVTLELYGDEEIVPFSDAEDFDRPDAGEENRNWYRENQKAGFRVTVTKLETLLEKYRQFSLIVADGEDRKVIWTRTSEEIRSQRKSQELLLHVDSVQKSGQQMVITGWALDYLREDHLCVRDEKGQPVSCSVERVSRPDVCAAFGLSQDFTCGFLIAVPCQGGKAGKIRLHIWNRETEREEVIDLKAYNYRDTAARELRKILSPSSWRADRRMISERGVSGFLEYVKDRMDVEQRNYGLWIEAQQPSKRELRRQRKESFAYAPLVSIVIPLYRTPLKYLQELLESIVAQSYENWELCLADGSPETVQEEFLKKNFGQEKRIRYQRLSENTGISGNTNAALAMATGELIMLCDHDDLVAPDALYEIVRAINLDPEVDVVYTDEDKVSMDGTRYFEPNFKPDFNLDLLRSVNYICHIFAFRKKLLDQVGNFRKEFDGAQDFDLILRCCEKSRKICHIPKVLYHWRAHENSTAGNPNSKQYAIDAGVKALEEHYHRLGIEAEVRYTDYFIILQTIRKVQGNPKVSILIPSKDHIEDLEKCIVSVEEKSTWRNFEIIVIENNSTSEETFAYYEELCRRYRNVKVVTWKKEFNYSAINNFGAAHADGDYYVLLNNDIEVITPEWMEWMLGQCQRSEVGIVGAKLYYPDDTVQHCGVVIGMGGFAGHILTRVGREAPGYGGRLKAIQDVSAVTAACLMIKRSTFENVDGLDEDFQVALNDVDLCLKVRASGQLVVLDPWVEMYHYESKSRGSEEDPVKKERFKSEIRRFRKKWQDILEKGDPYYSPNLSRIRTDCSLRGKYEHFDLIHESKGGK